jgi:aminoglycoside phosphotransferase (APT) family kinase protein
MTDSLGAALREVLGAAAIEGLRRLSGGASRETWSFTADGERLILQRERPGGVRTGGGMATEAALIEGAAAAGVPVAPLVASGDASSPVGAPFLVLGHVDGETIPRKLLRDEEFAAIRGRLAAQLGSILAAVHRIPREAGEGLAAQDQVQQFTELLDVLGEPHPALELGLRWLDGNRPDAGEPTIVHGDFRNGNLIVGPDGVRAVVDWELAHIGDPIEDLGWLCVKAWRFGALEPVGGFGSREELCAAYEAAGGRRVSVDALRWWELMGTVKWGVMCILQARTHLDGASRSVELAAIGRRVCENEHDVLGLLAEVAGWSLPTIARRWRSSSSRCGSSSRSTCSRRRRAACSSTRALPSTC